MDQVTTARPGLRSQAWQFARHYFEMCVAMCVGGAILTAFVFKAGPALLGYPDLREHAPELALVVVGVTLALPMAAWMRVRGMAWRPTLEMAGATVGLAIVLAGLAGLGVVPESRINEWVVGERVPAFCGPACAVMLVVMLFRLGLYTGRTGHHMGHGTHATRAA
jgi:hypothetical protein